MSIYIHEQMVVMVDWPAGAAASMILTIVTLIVLTIYGFSIKRHTRR
jgi:ABC-type spermidine/putrescine transport system permease subunit I